MLINHWSLAVLKPSWAYDLVLLILLSQEVTHVWASRVALVVKNPPPSAGDVRDEGLISVLGRSPGKGMVTHSMHWRRKWQPTPVFLPGESQGRWSLVGCCLWGRTESDTTEVT